MLISNVDVSWNFEAHCTQYKFWKNKIFAAKTRLQGMGAEQNRIFFAVLVRWVGHNSARLCLQYLVDFW